MITITNASKSFGSTHAVRDLSFTLEPGHMTGLLGPNGAGKTTTIRMIAGYLAPDSGAITLAGHTVANTNRGAPGSSASRPDPAAARRHLGYLPESAPLYTELKPRQYLDYRAKLFGIARRDRRAAVARVIDRCHLTDHAHKRIGALSKGYRQRVGLAAALIHDPPVLILDEPTNGLDPAQMKSTRALIAELAEDRTVLLCTHVIPEVERACRRVLVIAGGRLIADGPPDRVGNPTPSILLECRAAEPCVGFHDPQLRDAISNALGAGTTIAPAPPPSPNESWSPAEDRSPAEGRSTDWTRLRVTPDPERAPTPDHDPQAALAAALAGIHRPVRTIAPATPSLEERVVGLIEGAAKTAAANAHAFAEAKPQQQQ